METNEERMEAFRQKLEKLVVAVQNADDIGPEVQMGFRRDLEGAYREALEVRSFCYIVAKLMEYRKALENQRTSSPASKAAPEAAFWAFADDLQAYDLAVAAGGEEVNRKSVFRKRLLGRFANALGLPGIPNASKPESEPGPVPTAAGETEDVPEALKEPLAWLRGERSTCNYRNDPAQSALEDAANTQQAYWIVRAHREGLVELTREEKPK